MYKVRYQLRNDPNYTQAHGSDYYDLNDDKRAYVGSIFPYVKTQTVKRYIRYLCLENCSVLRVWVNNIIIYDWEHGIYKDDYTMFGLPL